jgi:hypothetical protein
MGAKEAYRRWVRQRNGEPGPDCLVKLVCDGCGRRWAERVRQTLPPCPECGSFEVYEYETIQVG